MKHHEPRAGKPRAPRKRISLSFALAAALAVAVPAQLGAGGDKPEKSQRAASAKLGAASLPSKGLSELRGASVYSSDGEKAGEISDFVLDFDSGEIVAALIDNEGAFTGSRLVDVAALSSSARDGRLQLSMSADDYDRVPDYDKRASARQNMGPVWNHATMPPAVSQPVPASAAGASDMAAKDHPAAMEDAPNVERNPNLAFAREVIDADIETRDGQDIGEVEALALSGKSVYAIVGDLEDELQLPENADRIAIRIDALDMASDDDLRTDIALSDIRTSELVVVSKGANGYDFGGERIVIIAKGSDLAALRR